MDDMEIANPISYDVGEICKCYFTDIIKNKDDVISQQINKCQSFCEIIKHEDGEFKEYTVKLLNKESTVKKLPGRCLRKVRLEPWTYKDACKYIGKVIQSKTNDCSMMITNVETSTDTVGVYINTLPNISLMEYFVFADTGLPCAKIITLKAEDIQIQ